MSSLSEAIKKHKDSLLAIAKEQDAENMKVKVNGWTYSIR